MLCIKTGLVSQFRVPLKLVSEQALRLARAPHSYYYHWGKPKAHYIVYYTSERGIKRVSILGRSIIRFVQRECLQFKNIREVLLGKNVGLFGRHFRPVCGSLAPNLMKAFSAQSAS